MDCSGALDQGLNFGAHWGIIGRALEQLTTVLKIGVSAEEFRLPGGRSEGIGLTVEAGWGL